MYDDAAALLLTALAAHRITRLIVRDDITRPLREAAFDRWPPTAERSRLRWNPAIANHVIRSGEDRPVVRPVATLLACTWCAGFWVTGALVVGQRLPRPVLTTFALASVVGLIGAADAALA